MAVVVGGLVGAEWFGSSQRWIYTRMVLKWLSNGFTTRKKRFNVIASLHHLCMALCLIKAISPTYGLGAFVTQAEPAEPSWVQRMRSGHGTGEIGVL